MLQQISELKALVGELQNRVSALEKHAALTGPTPAPPTILVEAAPNRGNVAVPKDTSSLPGTNGASKGFETVSAPSAVQDATPTATSPAKNSTLDAVLHGTTFNGDIDGYYGYNFNSPIGGANLLRSYDVSSNSFSLNQAGLVIENAPDLAAGKRFGARLDLQFGQATQTLQGNPANEPRPSIYRDVFQAYGTYIVPVGNGLALDFGKWASSLGYENNYTQYEMNYSRSMWYQFLPFYHMGLRANYKVNDELSLNYWIDNGTQQTEDFNGYKDELAGFVLTPSKNVSWTFNYYNGQEHPNFQYVAGAAAGFPTQQGMPFVPIQPAPNGKLHILDTYVSWNATPKLTLAAEADYVIERLFSYSPPQHTDGGAAYARYQFTPKIAFAARSEYLSDRGALFTGTTQAVKEDTFTFEYKFADGFVMREEWRRDFSNRPFFLTDTLGLLSKDQTTATIGLVWWFGPKQGAW